MNLKSLFKLFKLPLKGGKAKTLAAESQSLTRYVLSFTNIEDSPTYELKDHFTLGSDLGDMVLEDCNLSPKHASFSLKEGVVTVMDFGSASGTFIGDHQIEAGKSVILSDGDIVVMGDVQVQLLVQDNGIDGIEFDRAAGTPEVEATETEAPVEMEVEETEKPSESQTKTQLKAMPIKIEDEEPKNKTRERILDGQTNLSIKPKELKEDGTVAKRIQAMRALKDSGKKPPKKKTLVAGGGDRAANTLPRLVGIIFDILCVVIIWQIFSPFDDFRVAASIIPEMFTEFVVPEWNNLVALSGEQATYDQIVGEIAPIAKDLMDQFVISSILGLLLVWRLFTSLLLGSSLGMWMAGIRSYGSFLSKRAGGVIRELIGTVTFPFLIFDLPALFSRRTFKEVITRTNLYTPSKGAVIISWLFFFPLVLGGLIISPLFRGLEFNEKIVISDELSLRTKSRKEEEAPVEVIYQVYKSRWFGLQLELDVAKWIIVPRFTWSQTDKGSVLQPALVFHHEQEAKLPLLLLKNFDWYALLNLPMSHNPFLQNSFPEIWAYVQSQRLKDVKNIQYRPTEVQRKKFEVELQELVSTSFNLDIETMLEHVLVHGPLIKGLIEFRHELLALMDGSLEGDWKFSLQGKTIVLIREVNGVKPYDLIVPLNQGRGRIFKVSYGSQKEKQNLMKIMKELWAKVVWQEDPESEGIKAPIVIDIISRLASQGQIDEASGEKLFEVYFELAAKVVALTKEDSRNQSIEQSLKGLIDILQRFQKVKAETLDVMLMEKLLNKLNEVKTNLENRNASYFSTQIS